MTYPNRRLGSTWRRYDFDNLRQNKLASITNLTSKTSHIPVDVLVDQPLLANTVISNKQDCSFFLFWFAG